MFFHVHSVSWFSQTSWVPFLPHEPSGSERNPEGGNLSRYSPAVVSLICEPGCESCSARLFKNSGPSNHQCPKSSASKGAHRIGGWPSPGVAVSSRT